LNVRRLQSLTVHLRHWQSMKQKRGRCQSGGQNGRAQIAALSRDLFLAGQMRIFFSRRKQMRRAACGRCDQRKRNGPEAGAFGPILLKRIGVADPTCMSFYAARSADQR
jgi:hypothetical protein